ncbi:GNAT family N-acetyltransferase [Viridibacillus sp. FSL E2-0187]|uniref:GNAT family N-acetyltransferase n=1 Tax=Viridibacillus TaxID=496496 RepID=UPI00187B361B|nr:GNAT family N-acetyltransferase [Viridibacillus sp. JNUCC-6]QOV09568.1 GNAT family N-acetyltransferase [Viridibacillus sp. JNUCC-6]
MENKIEKKYIPLAEYFSSAKDDKIQLSFTEIETIMGHSLPNSSYLNKSWWKKTKPPLKHYLAWIEQGYYVTTIQPGYHVTFEKPSSNSNADLNSLENAKNTFITRSIEMDDARDLAKLLSTLDAETDFMLYGKNERDPSVQSVRKKITNLRKNNSSSIIVAVVEGQIGGMISISGNKAPRTKHRASIYLGIIQKFTNQGIGIALLKEAEKWAISNSIQRLELSVCKSNAIAINMFNKFGFIIDGERKKSLKMNEEFEDELYMSKLLNI